MKKIFKNKKLIFFTVALFTCLFFINLKFQETPKTTKTYTEFQKDLSENKIDSINIHNAYTNANEIIYTKIESKNKPEKEKKYYKVLVPSFSYFWEKFDNNQQYKNIKVNMEQIPEGSLIGALIRSLLPTLLFFGIIYYFMMRGMGANMKKSHIEKVNPENIKESFNDIIGIDEVKKEVKEIVDFLKMPEKFTQANAVMPKGIILSGNPGTGKTMLAKALAKEAGVPYFYCSGSSFVQMYVGLGAARIRSMFEETKKVAPCIIFIDEIDSIGMKRGDGSGMSGTHDEKENTLNELLTQMDGMNNNNGILLIGATNRPELLDDALMRAGRFDRKIHVPLPNLDGRNQLIQKLSNKYKINENLDFNKYAKSLIGLSGADITNLFNEAAILQVRKNKESMDDECFEEAIDKIRLGLTNNHKLNDKEKRMTAYHEAGHAIVGLFSKECDAVHKISITPRGMALGVTVSLPDEDKVSYTKDYLLSQISMLLGGYCAEEKFLNTTTTGVSNDIERATQIAKSMVIKFGMNNSLQQFHYSEKVLGNNDSYAYLSEKTKERIEQEIEDILIKQKQKTIDLLNKYEKVVHKMVDVLLEKETINEQDILGILKETIDENEIPKYLLK